MTELSGKVTGYQAKSGNTNGKDWTRHEITVAGQTLSSFNKTDIQELIDDMGSDKTFVVEYEQNGNYKNFKAILAAPTAAAPEEAAPASATPAPAVDREMLIFAQRSSNRRTALLTAKDLVVAVLSPGGKPPAETEATMERIPNTTKQIAEALLSFLEPPVVDSPPAQRGAQQRKAQPATKDTPSATPTAEDGTPDALDASSFWKALVDQGHSQKDVVDLVTQGKEIPEFMKEHKMTWENMWASCLDAFPLEARA